MSEKPARGIRRPLPPVGTSLLGKFKGKRYDAVIVEARDFPEKKAVKFDNILYRSMTAAAVAAVKYSTNGWWFWKIN